MHADLARFLVCPDCRAPYAVQGIDERDGRLLYGGLFCSSCQTIVPICAGFPLFPQTRACSGGWTRAEAENLEEETMGDPALYAALVRDQHQRPSRDADAIFQPFDQATRSLLPLVPLLRRRLDPGDLILDLSCRTGWSGEMLAALFPAQRVVSLWEGDSDILGYRGFRFWLGELERAANLDVLFRSLAERLPFADGSVSLVHGLDTLHRYPRNVLVPEVLRVLRRGGAAVGAGLRLADDAETSNDRALIALLPADAAAERLTLPDLDPPEPSARPVVNPMWTLDLHLGVAHIDADKFDGAVGRLLERHSIDHEHLARRGPVRLTQEECEFLYWADRCLDIEEIGARTARATSEVVRIAAALAARDIVAVRGVSRSMAVLQRFYGEQTMVEPLSLQTPQVLWRRSCRRFHSRPLLIVDGEGSVFTYGEGSEIVARVVAALRRDGVARGDIVCICAPFGAEAAFATWACLRMGALLAPLDWSAAPARLSSSLAWLRPKLVFASAANLPAVTPGVRCVVFDDGPGNESLASLLFSEWLVAEDQMEGQGEDVVDPEETAVLFQTSGTTGEPKFVELPHGALYRTGTRLVPAYGWNEKDVLVSTGDLHGMSGLRNPCVAAIAAGAAVVAVGANERRNPMALAEAIQRHRATILATTPGTLHLLSQYEGRLPPEALAGLRMVISTGSPLSPRLEESFRARFGVPVLDYYGLTEVAGGNVVVTPADVDRRPPGSIGRPLGCIAQIVDDEDMVLGPGQVGELCIYSDNLMRGYRMQSAGAAANVRNGWFHTGDIAVRDGQGFVTLLSRRRDVIKDTRGDLVYPGEVEAVLLTHPRVKDAGVCGFTAASGEERLAAFVVPDESVADAGALVDDLRRHVLQHLGPYRVPVLVEMMESLPRLPDGALLRRVLEARCAGRSATSTSRSRP